MLPSHRPFLFAVTGGIASGKSLFSQFLREMGLTVYDTDVIGHEVLDRAVIKEKLVSLFGSGIEENGKIDRKKLGEVIFHDSKGRRVLNSILHPEIIMEMQRLADKAKTQCLGFEIPLLFETGLEACFDYTILIVSENEDRTTRMKERGMDSKDISARMTSQLPDEVKTLRASCIIRNTNDPKQLRDESVRLIATIARMDKKAVVSFQSYLNHIRNQ